MNHKKFLSASLEEAAAMLEPGGELYPLNSNISTLLYELIPNDETNLALSLAKMALLFANGADPNRIDPDKNLYGHTPLTLAARSASKNAVDFMRVLIQAGADIEFRNGVGQTALLSAVSRPLREEVALYLVEAGANLEAEDKVRGSSRTAMMEVGYSLRCVKALLAAGANVNARSKAGTTPLIAAVHNSIGTSDGFQLVLSEFLRHGADLSARDEDGHKAIQHAVRSSRLSCCIGPLIQAGADVNERSLKGETLLMVTSSADAVARLLNFAPKLDEVDDEGNTALHRSANDRSEGVEIAKLLIKAGADRDVRNALGKTVLMEFATKGWKEGVKLLIDSGAELDLLDIDGRSATALAVPHINARRPHDYKAESIRLLIAAGAKPNPFENEPLMAALRLDDLPLAITLLERGAQISLGPSDFAQVKKSLEKIARTRSALLWGAVQCSDDETADLFARLIERHESAYELAVNDDLPLILRDNCWPALVPVRQPLVISADRFVGTELGRLQWSEGEQERAINRLRRSANSGKLAGGDPVAAQAEADGKLAADVQKFLKKPFRIAFAKLIRASDSLLLEVWNAHAGKFIAEMLVGESGRIEVADIGYLLARLGLPALPGILSAVRNKPELTSALLAVDAPACAPLVASLMAAGAGARPARQWLLAWPESACNGLLPASLGQAGKDRELAEPALRFLAFHGHGLLMNQMAAGLGEDVSAALTELLALDPCSDFLPKKRLALPSFWSSDYYPAPRLKESGKALPATAIRALGKMMAASGAEVQSLGIAAVIKACEPGSLADFAWAVFEEWAAKGDKTSDWMFNSLAYFGDDNCARKLTPYLREWPKLNGTLKAKKGLAIMAAIGSDVALSQIQAIALKNKYRPVLECAQQMLELIARTRNLSAEELEDRLVSTLGLSDAGTMAIDYGTRQFIGSVDAQLKPLLHDNAGVIIKTLPSAGKADDKALAEQQAQVWAALCKELKPTAKLQLERFERAMVDAKRWSGKDFKSLLACHPLLQSLVRGLVWGTFQSKSLLLATFRVLPTGKLVDVAGAAFKLSDTARVGVAHPLLFQPSVEDWKKAFAQTKQAQPFAQLVRKAFRKTDDVEGNLFGLQGATVAGKALKGLQADGWNADIEDAGWIWSFHRKLASGSAWLSAEPGVHIDDYEWGGVKEQTLTVEYGHELTDIDFSELTRELMNLKK